MMPLADAKAIVELANDVAILAERVDGEEGRAVLEKHAELIAEARRIVSSTKERAAADVGDERPKKLCQACGVHGEHARCTGETTLGTSKCECDGKCGDVTRTRSRFSRGVGR